MRWMGWSYPDLLACPADYYDELVALYEIEAARPE